MAPKSSILLLACFLLVAVQVSSNEGERYTDQGSTAAVAPASAPAPAPAPAAHPPASKVAYVNISECPKLCAGRCAKHSRPKHCHRACGTCCERCKCVPPGTYGNREMCGTCYTDMTTHNNRSKCP